MWSAIAGVLISALSSAISSGSSAYSSRVQTNRAEAMAERQMRFQRNQRSTSYQVAMEDMRRAGLNPMLAYDQGGAQAMSGAMGTATGPDFSGAVSSALQAARVAQEFRQIDASIKNLAASTKKQEAEADVAKEVIQRTKAETSLTQANSALTQYNLPKAKTRAELEKSLPGRALTTFERIMESIGALFGRSPSGRALSR